jgi:hypothetical protein
VPHQLRHAHAGIDSGEIIDTCTRRTAPMIPVTYRWPLTDFALRRVSRKAEVRGGAYCLLVKQVGRNAVVGKVRSEVLVRSAGRQGHWN